MPLFSVARNMGILGTRKRIVRTKPLRHRGYGKKTNLAKTKDKIWSLKKADTMFREYMLETVPVRCIFPDCPITDPAKLTVSHYHGRARKGTRYHVLNCDFLCRNHHYWDKQRGYEFQKQREEIHGWDGRYTLYMKAKLGDIGFLFLERLANSGMKQRTAIQDFQSLYQSLL